MDGPDEPPSNPGTGDHDLVARCLDALQEGGEPAVQAVLDAHPERAAWLRERLAKLAQVGLLPAAAPAAEFPERLGEHRLLRRLGAGGMGVVYLAEQTTLGRTVALKVLRPEQRFFPGAQARFRREIEVIARLGDPGIVPIYTVGEADGVDFFTMEYLRGAALGEVVAALTGSVVGNLRGSDLAAVVAAQAGEPVRSPLPEVFAGSWVQVCSRIAARMARAVHHAHDSGVVHRDLKPNNAMVTTDGRVLLLDFGLAAAAGADRITRSGALLGTMHYMAPEQLEGGAVDERTDVYALGVTLHELLTLRPPFHAVATERLRQLILQGGARSLRRDHSWVPRDIESIARQAMDPDPARRYPSALALAEDLERFLELRPVRARPAGPITRAARWAQRHPVRSTVGALLVVVTAVGTGLWRHLEDSAAQRIRAAENLALTNLRGAIGAIDRLIRQAREGPMSVTPGLDAIRLRELREAVALIEQLRAENTTDPTIRQLSARGMLRAAELHNLLGDFATAESTLAAAEPLLRELRELHPEDGGYREDEMWLRLIRSTTLVGLSRMGEAAALWQAMLTELERPGAAAPSPVLAQIIGTCHNNLGRLKHSEGDAVTAITHLRAALDAERHVPSPSLDQRLDGVRTRMNLVALLQLQKADDEARRMLDDVLTALARLAAEQPQEPEIARERARAEFAAAQQAAAAGDRDGARARRTTALTGMQELVKEYPTRVAYRQELGLMAFEASTAELEAGALDEARRLSGLALAQHEGLRRDFPQAVEYASELATFLRQQSGLVTAGGDTAAALAILDRALELQRWALAQLPDDLHFLVQLAALHQEVAIHHVRAERWHEALAALQQAETAYGKAYAASYAPVLEPRRYPQLLMVLAQVQLMCDDFDGVVQALTRLQQVRPMLHDALREVGIALHVDDRDDFAALLEAAPR